MSADLEPVSMKKGRRFLPRLSPKYEPGRRSRRFWTPEEEAIVRACYPAGGTAACQVKLPGRSVPQIYKTAHRMGLRAPSQSTLPRRRHVCTPELETKMRERWPTLVARGSIAAFAEELGEPKWWLLKQAARLGLLRLQRKEPPWSRAEEELMAKVPLHDPGKAARIFREHGFSRSATAIVIRAKRRGMSRRYRETLSGTAVSRILGLNNKTVTAWLVAGKLKGTRRGTQRLPQQGGDAWSVQPADLRQYIIDNVAMLDIRKVDAVLFVDLLVSGGAVPGGAT